MTDEQMISIAATSKARANELNDKSHPMALDPDKATDEEKFAAFASTGKRLGMSDEQIRQGWENSKTPHPVEDVMEQLRLRVEQMRRQEEMSSFPNQQQGKIQSLERPGIKVETQVDFQSLLPKQKQKPTLDILPPGIKIDVKVKDGNQS